MTLFVFQNAKYLSKSISPIVTALTGDTPLCGQIYEHTINIDMNVVVKTYFFSMFVVNLK